MSSREFVDSEGRAWRVWNTVPSERGVLAAGYAEGWLTFESSSELRRLAPIPIGWEELSDLGLATLCTRAAAVTRRQRPPQHVEPPPDDEPPTQRV